MKILRPILLLTAVYLAAILCLTQLTGCTANSPLITADKSDLASIASQITAVQKQIAVASTQPATDPAVLTQMQAQLAALLKQQVDDTSKLASDTSAVKTAQVQTGTQVAQAVATAIPSPWAPFAVALIGVAGAVAVSFINKGSAQTTSNNHAAVVGNAITALANSVPIATLPASAQAVLKQVVPITQAVVGAVEGGTTTTTTTTTPAVAPAV